jgi:hypothetical protein
MISNSCSSNWTSTPPTKPPTSVYGPDTVVLPNRQELLLSARSILERIQTRKQPHRGAKRTGLPRQNC